MKKFALAGNPNCGKTTLFNVLTGSTAHVGNWPGVTVDKKEGAYKKGSEPVSILDLPGIYSLSPYTPEEVISRNYIIEEKPDCIINIVDATNLERNLYLTTQLMEADIPIVIALNMMDEVSKKGDHIDAKKLSKIFNIPVVEISALKGENIDKLMEVAIEESKKRRTGVSVLSEGKITNIIEKVKKSFIEDGIEDHLFHAIKIIENDEIESKKYSKQAHEFSLIKNSFKDDILGNDYEAIIADERYKYISKHLYTAYKKNTIKQTSKSEKIDKVVTSKWFGIPLFLIILFLIFHLTFSENLFYLGGLFENVAPSFEGSIFEGLFWTDAGINSPGVILFNLVDCLTSFLSDSAASLLASSPGWVSGLIVDGILGGVFAVLSFVPQILLLFLFFSFLEDSGYMARVAFILDRILRKFGVSGRALMPMIMGFGCSVPAIINTRTLADENERLATIRVIPFFSCGAKLPILTAIAGAICVVFNFPNADIITFSMYIIGMLTAITTIIIMRKTSMKGKASPFIMELPEYHQPQFKSLMIHLWDKLKHYIKKAFTIILASTIIIWFLQSFTWKLKYIEQLDINEICEEQYQSYLFKDNNTEKIKSLNEEYIIEFEENELSELILTNDSTHLSDIITDYQDLKDNLNDEESINKYNIYTSIIDTIFENSFNRFKEITNEDDYIDASDSIIASIGMIIQPIFTPLGFGANLNKESGWIFGVSAITGLIAKENVIATFTVLSQCSATNSATNTDDFKNLYYSINDEAGVNSSIQVINASGIDTKTGWPILIAYILFNMTTIPCFAAVATAKGELTKKKFWSTILFWILTSYILGTMAFCILSYWWSAFIFALIAFIIGLSIHFYNKRKEAVLL